MFVRHADYEWELLKWLVVLALAAALMLTFASALSAADAKTAVEPALLSPMAAIAALPMPSETPLTEAAALPEATPAGESSACFDAARQVWRALELQQTGQFPEAIEAWKDVVMDCDGEVWQWAALGHAYMVWGEFDLAEESLQRAAMLDPENAVVHYFSGLLFLEKSHWADAWNDADARPSVRLVAASAFLERAPAPFSNYNNSHWELAAIVELEAAIAHASSVRLDQSLLPVDWPTAAAIEPTVHDLLFAVGADHFAARAHNLLGALKLESGFYEQAEQHFDAAQLEGQSAWLGYRDLGKQYDAEGRHLDAFRVHVKAMKSGNGVAGPAADAWQSFRNAFHNLWLAP